MIEQMEEGEEGEGAGDEKSAGKKKKRRRQRKRHFFLEVLRQMEFYFSDANLAKSKFMKEQLEKKGPWINLQVCRNGKVEIPRIIYIYILL